MGKASRKKQLDEQRKQFFAIHGDGRSAEDRANALAMLDALQKKLEDDALREDGTNAAIEDKGSGFAELTLAACLYSSDNEPNVHLLDYHNNAIIPAKVPVRAFDVASNYCIGHQQPISSMAFSHNGELLATSSWDSTSIVWKVKSAMMSDNLEPEAGEVSRLIPLLVLPVHEEGATCLAFTIDDQSLVTCGECIVKLWNISDSEAENQSEDDETNKSLSLADQLLEWQQAIPYSLSIESSTNLFAFDESMTVLTANHDWKNFHPSDKTLTILAPAQSECERNKVIDIKQCIDHIIEEIDPQEDELQTLLKGIVGSQSAQANSENNSPSKAYDGGGDGNALTVEERARLKTQFRNMEDFDFEKLFTPALSLSMGSEAASDPLPAKAVTRVPHRPDGNGRLLRTFSKHTSDGVFSSHSSTITGCAVAKELDLVVTVGLDKSIRYWSLEEGIAIETVFDAHSAPITCCALTSPTTCDLSLYDMLLATGGSDNLVKVWQRSSPDRAQCVFSLTGHNDIIKSIAFDPNGIFLTSTSEDTTAIIWRVRPSSPDQPEVPLIVSVDRFAISISWTEPLANGAKILHYVVRTKQVSSFTGDGSDILVVPDTEVPAKYVTKTIDKLQPGVHEYSAATEPVETLAFIPSRIDRPVQHDNREATRITLSWTPPCPNGASILSYTIQCRPENDAFVPLREVTIPVHDVVASFITPVNPRSDRRCSSIATKTPVVRAEDKHSSKTRKKTSTNDGISPPAAINTTSNVLKSTVGKAIVSHTSPSSILSYTVDNLWAGEVYQFVVAASNRCGLGEFSRVSDYVKMDCMAPDQPAQPQIVNVDKRQITVQWEKPRCNGSKILQYSLRWRQEVEGYPGTNEQIISLLSRSIAGTNYTLTDLQPGSPVQVWVSAFNLVDNKLLTSLESLPSNSVATLCDVPDTPDAPSLMDPSAHTLVLVWTPPMRNGLLIEGYNVALYSEDTQFGVCVRQLSREITLSPDDLHQPSSGATTVAFVLHHLRGGTFYSATISAHNSLGASGVSIACVPVQTSEPTVPDTIPEAPAVSDVTPTSVVLAWKLPAHDGGSALRGFHVEYTVRSNRNDAQFHEKMESGGDITVSRGLELHATFLKPHRVYQFRVSPENRVGRAIPSAWSEEIATPSLVEFTVTRYFAYRPPEEHEAARFIQRRYRDCKKATADKARFTAALVEVLRHWHL
ncbi:unnamed protein product [Phytophthora lilii]|uniref:Unnamed protein product n=1 Tax=Phytophthora lilii TaxID=2077276 RepID=A0A9W6XA29_9STRA|nr:unnamed protein product [Phytophthora lilii]